MNRIYSNISQRLLANLRPFNVTYIYARSSKVAFVMKCTYVCVRCVFCICSKILFSAKFCNIYFLSCRFLFSFFGRRDCCCCSCGSLSHSPLTAMCRLTRQQHYVLFLWVYERLCVCVCVSVWTLILVAQCEHTETEILSSSHVICVPIYKYIKHTYTLYMRMPVYV